jgi:archaellum biogenesis protein FlaJ (TadC family)
MVPATETVGEPDILPLLGYTAAAMENGKVYVAARQTDEHKIWHPDNYNTADLPDRIRKVKKAFTIATISFIMILVERKT